MPPPGPPRRPSGASRARDSKRIQPSAAEPAKSPLISLEIMFLSSLADRKRLCQGDEQLAVHVGQEEVFRVHWNLFRSISTKAALAEPLDASTKVIRMPAGLHPGAFRHIMHWLRDMLNAPGFFLMEGRDAIEEDVPLCRAARLLGLEEYARHILVYYWNTLDETLPSFGDLVKLEKSATVDEKMGLEGYDGCMLLKRACEHLARLFCGDGVPDFEQWTAFLTAHQKIKTQVCDEIQRLQDERSGLKSGDAQQEVAAGTTDTGTPQVKPEEGAQTVTSCSAREVEVTEDSHPATHPKQQAPSQGNERQQSLTARNAHPHETMYADHGGRAVQPEMDLDAQLRQLPWDHRNAVDFPSGGTCASAVPQAGMFPPSNTTYQGQQPITPQAGGFVGQEDRVDTAKQRNFNTQDHLDHGPWNRKSCPSTSTPIIAPAVSKITSPGGQDAHSEDSSTKPTNTMSDTDIIDTAGADLVALAKKLFPTPKDPQAAIAWLYPMIDALRGQNEVYRKERYRASMDPNFEFSNPVWQADWSHKPKADQVQQIPTQTAGPGTGYLHQAPGMQNFRQGLGQSAMTGGGPGTGFFGYRQEAGAGSGNAGAPWNAGVIGDPRRAGQDAGIIGHRRNTNSGNAGARANGGDGGGRRGPGVFFF